MQQEAAKMNVFVYGTLKTGEPNHHWLQCHDKGESHLLGVGETVECWPLVVVTKYNIPMMLGESARNNFHMCEG